MKLCTPPGAVSPSLVGCAGGRAVSVLSGEGTSAKAATTVRQGRHRADDPAGQRCGVQIGHRHQQHQPRCSTDNTAART